MHSNAVVAAVVAAAATAAAVVSASVHAINRIQRLSIHSIEIELYFDPHAFGHTELMQLCLMKCLFASDICHTQSTVLAYKHSRPEHAHFHSVVRIKWLQQCMNVVGTNVRAESAQRTCLTAEQIWPMKRDCSSLYGNLYKMRTLYTSEYNINERQASEHKRHDSSNVGPEHGFFRALGSKRNAAIASVRWMHSCSSGGRARVCMCVCAQNVLTVSGGRGPFAIWTGHSYCALHTRCIPLANATASGSVRK